MMRSFIAVELSEKAREKIGEFEKELQKKGAKANFCSEENLHCTLLFLGEKSEGELKGIVERKEQKLFIIRTRSLPLGRFSGV
jgi:2'-5' RNA ligase